MEPKESAMRTSGSRRIGNQAIIQACGLVLAILLALGFGSTDASAQVLVANPPLQAANHSDFLAQLEKTISQYEKQIQQYDLQLQQYQQMLINIRNLGNQVPAFNNNLQHLDAAQLQAVQCDGAAGSSWIGNLVVSVFAPTSPYSEGQQKICENIVAIQVQKYNETADMLARMNQYAALARDTESERDAVGQTDNGDLNSNSNQVARNSAELDLEMSNWQARMRACDAEIGALQATQSLLAAAEMKARTPDLLGTSVQAAALKAALTVNQ
jgi:conjugal transfer/entry exclusion protein